MNLVITVNTDVGVKFDLNGSVTTYPLGTIGWRIVSEGVIFFAIEENIRIYEIPLAFADVFINGTQLTPENAEEQLSVITKSGGISREEVEAMLSDYVKGIEVEAMLGGYVKKGDLEKRLGECVKLKYLYPQIIESDIIIQNGKKILLERKDRQYVNGLSMSGKSKTKTVSLLDLKPGDIVSGKIVTLMNTDKKPDPELTGKLTVRYGYPNGYGDYGELRTTTLNTPNPTRAIYAHLIARESWIYSNKWDVQSFQFYDKGYYPTTVSSNTLTRSSDPSTYWGFEMSEVEIIETYEQTEVGADRVPLCLNHSAVSTDGTVVGKNPILNYKDENGAINQDQIATISDIAP